MSRITCDHATRRAAKGHSSETMHNKDIGGARLGSQLVWLVAFMFICVKDDRDSTLRPYG